METVESPVTVLIVDDQPAVLDLMRTALKLDGYRLIASTSAREALEAAAATPIDVLVTDLVLTRQGLGGDMGGMELAWRLMDSHEALRVVMVSGFADGDAAISTFPPDRVTFVSKPFAVSTLRAAVSDAVLASRRPA